MNTYNKMAGGQQLTIALSSGKSGFRRERHGDQELRGVKKVITCLWPHKKVAGGRKVSVDSTPTGLLRIMPGKCQTASER